MTEHATDTPALRYSRFGGGYRREDVEAALEQLLDAIRSVELDLSALRERSAALEDELDGTRQQLAAYQAREEQLLTLIARAEALVADVERDPMSPLSEGR